MLPEVYPSVVGLHRVSLFICLFIFLISVSTPTVLCKLLGVDAMVYTILLFI